MTAPTRSEAADAWEHWYDRRGVWWGRPEELSTERLRAWGRQDWLAAIVSAARIAPHARVLEAGCGSGQGGLALALEGYEVDLLDYSHAALDRARELTALLQGACDPPTLFQGDLLRLPTAADAYDLVFNQGVIEYFLDDEKRSIALAEMARTTRPGGAVVVVVNRPRHPLSGLWRRTGWRGFVDQPEIAHLTARTMEADLLRAGLVDVASDGVAPWRALFFWPRWYDRWAPTRRGVGALTRWLEHITLPRPIRRWLGLQLLVVGTKPPESTFEREGGG